MYRIQEAVRDNWNAEGVVGIVVLLMLVACGMASVPKPHRIAGEELAISLRRDKQRAAEIQSLRDENESLQSKLQSLSKTLESTRADLASFRQAYDTFYSQAVTTTAKVQEIESTIEDAKAQSEKIRKYTALQEQLQKERDEALTQAKDAADRVRELTLKLQRAGVYP